LVVSGGEGSSGGGAARGHAGGARRCWGLHRLTGRRFTVGGGGVVASSDGGLPWAVATITELGFGVVGGGASVVDYRGGRQGGRGAV
jgi:hypothetical protein